MSIPARDLVARLADFRERPAAKLALVNLGDEAVDALLEGLKSAPPSARWTILSALEGIRTDRALRGLIDALGTPGLSAAASDALTRVAGRSMGTDKHAWTRWLRQRGRGAETADAEVPAANVGRPLSNEETLLRDALDGTGATFSSAADGYQAVVPLPGTRHQKLHVLFSGKDSEGARLAVIYTPCGPANEKNYEWALRRNLRMAYGSIGIMDLDGKPMFVAVNTLLVETLDAQELRKTLLYLAQRADKLESKLTGGADVL